MDARSIAATCRIGMIAASAVTACGLAYAITLGTGLLALPAADQPIGDPWFSVLELLIIVMMPALVTMMAAVHAWAPEPRKALSLAALIFMGIAALLTTSVHFTIIVLSRAPGFADQPWARQLLSFHWPSLPYVIDILAWDLFFALAMLFAAPIFAGSRLASAIRTSMLVSGLLALAGLSGAATGNMALRNIGILGYAGIFPIVAGMLAAWFRREGANARP